MDLVDFPDSLSYLSTLGVNLSREQRAAMKVSLKLVGSDYRFSRVVLWGRVVAHQRDYYIAVGHTEEEGVLGRGTVFVSQSLTKWAQLPRVAMADAERARGITAGFTGDLSYEYKFTEEAMPWEPEKEKRYDSDGEEIVDSEDDSLNGEEDEEDEEEEEDNAGANDPLAGRFKKVKKRKSRKRRFVITEEKRLSAVVDAIIESTSVVPRGAFVIDQRDIVTSNPSFAGLPRSSCDNLSFYLHLRKPKVLPKKTLHERYSANLVYDFLDRLDEDVPQGQWAIQAKEDAVTLRSLLWPGYYAFHVPDSQKFGAFYSGTGQINSDIGFMI